MAVSYRNRRGVNYYLCEGVTKRGKPRYYFARKPRDSSVGSVPPGYAIRESVNAVVSLAKIHPPAFRADEVAIVESAIQRHPKAGDYRIDVVKDAIVVYGRVGPDLDEIAGVLGNRVRALAAWHEERAQFAPVMRFRLLDPQNRTFLADRMTYRGSGGWMTVGTLGPLPRLTRQLIPKLGTDAFFELY